MSIRNLTFDDFKEGVRGCLGHLFKSFRTADEDVTPMLHCWKAGQGMQVVAIDMTQQMKERLPRLLIDVFREILPDYAAFITGAFVRKIDIGGKDLDDPMVVLALQMEAAFGAASHPESKEILQVIFSRPGVEEFWDADVTRRQDQPPLLGEFTKFEFDEMGGKMSQMLIRAFEACSRKKARKR